MTVDTAITDDASDLAMLTERQVAELMSVSMNTLAIQRHRDQGPPYIRVGRAVRYPRAGLAKYIADRTVTPSGSP